MPYMSLPGCAYCARPAKRVRRAHCDGSSHGASGASVVPRPRTGASPRLPACQVACSAGERGLFFFCCRRAVPLRRGERRRGGALETPHGSEVAAEGAARALVRRGEHKGTPNARPSKRQLVPRAQRRRGQCPSGGCLRRMHADWRARHGRRGGRSHSAAAAGRGRERARPQKCKKRTRESDARCSQRSSQARCSHVRVRPMSACEGIAHVHGACAEFPSCAPCVSGDVGLHSRVEAGTAPRRRSKRLVDVFEGFSVASVWDLQCPVAFAPRARGNVS